MLRGVVSAMGKVDQMFYVNNFEVIATEVICGICCSTQGEFCEL